MSRLFAGENCIRWEADCCECLHIIDAHFMQDNTAIEKHNHK
jgi:hypothetical protein